MDNDKPVVGKAPPRPKSEDRRRFKAEETTRAAQEIIAGETAVREKGRARQKGERLAKEAAEQPTPPKAPKSRARSRKTSP